MLDEFVACNCELTPDPIDPCWSEGCDCAWDSIVSSLYGKSPHLFGGWRPNQKDGSFSQIAP